MGLSFDDAVGVLGIRQNEDSLLKRHMIAVRDRYNGDFVIPLADVEGEPSMDAPIPALIAEAIDNTAMRAASTRPQIFVPSSNVSSARANDRADSRRKAYYAVWHDSKLPIKLRRACRHLVGYGVSCMGVMPYFDPKGNYDKDAPCIEVRDPLTAYPDEMSSEEIRLPVNIGFIYPRSPDWIVKNYPMAREHVSRFHSDLWDVFEWIDDTNVYIGILGPRNSWATGAQPISTNAPLLLRRWDNKAGIVPFVCPGRVTLDRIAGQVTKMVGIVDLYAKLMALEAVAAEKGVFADKYLMSRSGEEIQLVSGDEWKDGRTGEINMMQGVEKVGELGSQLNPMTFNVADRLERSVRMSTGQPGLFGGEATGNIRSGQTVTQLGAYAIDPRIMEVQEVIEYQLTALNQAICATYKGYWPEKKFTIFSGWPSELSYVELTPGKDMEDDANVVSYGVTGADISQLSVALGQAMQMKILGRRTAQRKHPLVDNPQDEEQAIIEEALTDAALASFLARAQQGTIAEIDLMNVLKHYGESHDFIAAIMKAQEDAQKRQATEAPPPEPGQATAPEQQPGLSPAGTAGVEQPGAPSGAPGGPGIEALLSALTSQGGAGPPQGAPVPAGVQP